jgi:hypothetical protein
MYMALHLRLRHAKFALRFLKPRDGLKAWCPVSLRLPVPAPLGVRLIRPLLGFVHPKQRTVLLNPLPKSLNLPGERGRTVDDSAKTHASRATVEH